MEVLYQNLLNLDIKMVIMWLIGGVLIYLAIKKDMEPTLLLPMGFGAILVNLPSQQRDYLYTLLPHVTFNGEIASRRTVWVGNVVDELEAM